MDLREQLQSTLGSTYNLDRELGSGGMSRVFLAEETRLGRKVVIKVLAPELAVGISAERFEREIRVAASLQQANIVPVLAAGETNGLPYYTMPFVEGLSLRVRMAKTAEFSIAEVVHVLRDVVRALGYAHEHGVVHRDIKPDNVLLSRGAAVVTDFGIAKALSASRVATRDDALTQDGVSLGTPAYMSPEQVAGDPDIDHRADLYAFGCMAYELLAGRPPFHERTPQRVYAGHLNEVPQPVNELRTDIPEALSQLIMRCLAKEPSARPQSAMEIEHALELVTVGSSLQGGMQYLPGGPRALRLALVVYAVAFAVVAVVARAAIGVIGLPDWVFPGALIVMALGLPVVLLTAFVPLTSHRALTSPPPAVGGGGAPSQGLLASYALKASPHLSWRRTALGGAYALGAFTLLVAVFMTLRALGIGPAGSLLASGKLSRREPLLIADFAANNVDSTIASVVTEAFRADLSLSSAITLVSPASVGAALRRMQRPATSRVDLTLARDVAAREGINAIVDGGVTALGSGYLIVVRLVSADSGDELVSFRAAAQEPKDLIALIDDLSRRLRERIGESLRAVHRSPPLAQVTTSSLDALRTYTAALRANDVENNFPKAVRLLREAVALDSTFGMAWRKLVLASGNAGLPQVQIDSATVRAFQLRDRLPPSERLLSEATYFAPGLGRDRAKAIAAYESLLSGGDSSSQALNGLGLLYASRRNYAGAESLFAASMRLDQGMSLSYANIIMAAQVNRGQLSEAHASVQHMLAQFPSNLPIRLLDGWMLYHQGDLRAYEQFLEESRKSNSVYVRATAMRSLVSLAKSRGRLSDSERLTVERRTADSTLGRHIPAIAELLAGAIDDAWYRNLTTRAEEKIDALVARFPLNTMSEYDRPYLDLAVAYSIAGRPDRSRALLAQLTNDIKDTALIRDLQPDVHHVLAEIALAENRPLDAISEFRLADVRPDGPANACNTCLFAGLGRAFLLADQSDSAITMLEKYLETPHFWRFQDVDPRLITPAHKQTYLYYRFGDTDPGFLAWAYQRLGELYEEKGERSKAITYFTKFAELWKDADPDLQPRVAAVRARLEKLRAPKRG